MARINIVKVSMNIKVRVSSELLEERTGYSPLELGEKLAQQVYAYARQQGLGYFPPLVYCHDHGVLDDELLGAHQRVAGYACQFANTEVRMKVMPVFSHLRIEQVQSTAYSMPHVRKGQNDDLGDLARHFTPDQVKMELIASSLQRTAEVDGIENLSAQKVRRWLEGRFESVDVTGAHVCNEQD